MTMFFCAGGLVGIALCQGNGSRGSIRVFGEKALVSTCSINFLTCVGSLVTRSVIESRMDERFVGTVCLCFFCRSKRF